MSGATITRLVLAERARRIGGLVLFAILFIVSGLTARLLTGEEGHVEMGQLMLMGGYPAVSALLLLGWLLGRYPIIASVVLLTGLFSADRSAGFARLYSVRPVSFLKLYGIRFLLLLGIAFALSASLLPLFDIIMLGQWAGPATLVVVGCYVLVYGSLVALLSLFTRGEGWITMGLAITAMIWDALRRGGALDQAPPGVREAVSFILPPQGPLFRIEGAFAALQPIPWIDVAYVCGYAVVVLIAAAVFIGEREV